MAENKFEFTEAAIHDLPCPIQGKRAYFYDTLAPGLGVAVTPAGTRTFIVYRWVNGRPERITLGRYPELSLNTARQKTHEVNARIAHGINPNQEKKRIRAGSAITLSRVLEDFLASRPHLSQRTIYDYRRIVRVYLQDWCNQPVAAITPAMAEARFKAISQGMQVVVNDRMGGERSMQVRSVAQASYSMRVLRVLLNFAMGRYRDQEGHPLVVENPVQASYQAPAAEVEHNRPLTPQELQAWFRAVSQLKSEAANARPEVIRSYLIFLLLTGMKSRDACKLRKTQLDLRERTLTMFDVAQRQPRVLPLSDYLYVMLRKLAESTEGPYLFPGSGPRGYLVDSRKQLLKIAADSGVEFTLNDLRHTFIEAASGLDIPAYALTYLLDRKRDRYMVVDVEKLRGPMQVITDFLLKNAGAKKSTEAIALLSDPGADRLKEKLSHILAVRHGMAMA